MTKGSRDYKKRLAAPFSTKGDLVALGDVS